VSPWFLVALFLCPAGAVVDRVEGDAVVVLGASGVHVVARAALITAPARRVHEGDRVLAGPGGGCRAVPPSRAEVDRLRQRLRALGTR
jgi:hypothetical protein